MKAFIIFGMIVIILLLIYGVFISSIAILIAGIKSTVEWIVKLFKKGA